MITHLLKRIMPCLMLLGILFLTGINAGVIEAQTSAASEPFDNYLMRYFDAINQGDYRTAYAMRYNPTQTYENFVAGYADTTRIVPYFGFTGVAAGTTYITTILLGYQTDGTVKSYYGNFRMTYGSIFDPIVNNGGPVMLGADFALVKDGEALHNTSIQYLLSEAWDANHNIPTDVPNLSAMSSIGSDLLLGYYDLINGKNYRPAYDWWLVLSDGSHSNHLSYEQFAAGYQDTAYVTVYVGDIQAVSATSIQGLLVPAVLISQHTDGNFTTYSGCYGLSQVNGIYKIAAGKFTKLLANVPDSATAFNALNNLNCAALLPG
ncbi:MAG TPA: hypothetical protein VHL11_23020 [Phototrophicaceae bacterium]|nr:hypothetical protein [Phototrophicaceae bacterium]